MISDEELVDGNRNFRAEFLEYHPPTKSSIDRSIAARSDEGRRALFVARAMDDRTSGLTRRGVCPVVVAVRDDWWTSRETPWE